MVSGGILGVTEQLIEFFIPEALFLIFVKRVGGGFKFRFSSVKGYPGLKPFASAWSVGIVAFLIFIFATPIYQFLLGTTINAQLLSLGDIRILALTTFLTAFTLLFIVNHLLGKKFDRNSWFVIIVMGISAYVFFSN